MSSNNNSNNIWKYIGIGAGIGAIGGAIIGGDVVGAVVGVFFGASGGTIVGANTLQSSNTSTSQSNIYTTPKKAPLVLKNWSKHGITSKSYEELKRGNHTVGGAIIGAFIGVFFGVGGNIVGAIVGGIVGSGVGGSYPESYDIDKCLSEKYFDGFVKHFNALSKEDRQNFLRNLNNKTAIAYTMVVDKKAIVPTFKEYIQAGNSDKVRLFIELGMVDSVEELKTYLANASSKLKLELQDLLGEDSISEKDMQQAIDSGYSASHGEMQRMFQRGLKSKNADMMKTAINNGYKASDEELLEMLNHSVESKNKDMIMFAIQHGADLFTQANPLIVSCEILQDVNFVQVSINKGYDIYQPHNGMTLIEYAFSQGNKAICELLFKTHGDVNTPFPSGESIMHLASKYDLSYLIKDTLKKGYDVNTLDQKGFTMLDYAVESKRVDVGLLLIDNGGLLA